MFLSSLFYSLHQQENKKIELHLDLVQFFSVLLLSLYKSASQAMSPILANFLN